ncbi:MAG: dTDP-4-dehydrorhamnose 3,5-epimerase family protein [Chloracidobacterium sp.]|nr:dTDP-4-dehydrorhamnose 3,5-epimerase family protein [Chloracidobacterium sp.]MCC6825714.1 dTDP-4-dehydrorhamnose 3,5-epimerase family protein [Acidobacteriota bacterium]
MAFIDETIADVVVYPLKRYTDERGWLTELFRNDEIAEEFHPAMSYISFTKPGVARGPHEHVDQADLFCFLGPSTFKLRMWDNRPASPTYNHRMTLFAGENEALAVIVPKGVVHGYKNVGETDGMVINCPNKLYMGAKRTEPIDEVRHEDDPETLFKMDDRDKFGG